MLRTALVERFGLSIPLVGAPMAGISGGRLAGAVSNGGGLGMIGVGNASTGKFVSSEAAQARQANDRFGIGLMAWALEDHPEQFDAAVQAEPALISVSFGEYAPWVERLHDAGIAAATQIGDVESARVAQDCGVDWIVARGAEAGGHGHNRVATLPLIQGVLDAVDVPVLAAGGIATARGIAAVLAAGATGAWIGTALLTCIEATNSHAARNRIRAAHDTDTVYTRVFDVAQDIPWPTEFGGRALENEFSRQWDGRENELGADAAAHGQMRTAKEQDDFDTAYLYAGQGVGMVGADRSATAVVVELAEAAEALLKRWQ